MAGPYFQSLGELGDWFESHPGMYVVDAGIPLVDYVDGAGGEFGAAWSRQPSIRKVAGFIARNVSSINLHLYDRISDTDRVRVTDHPLARLLARPSTAPAETPYRFWERMLIDGLIHDRWCALVRANADEPELVRIPARRVRFESDNLDRIVKVHVWFKDGTYAERNPDGFLLDVGYSERGASGTSPMATLRHLLQEQAEAIAYRRGVWQRGARIPAVIERPNKWPADGVAKRRFEQDWKAFESGGGREGGTPVLDDSMKYRTLDAFKPQDTGDLEGRRLSDIEVAAAYHIAPELVGAREGNYSNIEAFRQMLYREHLGPYIDAWSQALNAALIPMFAPETDYYIEPNLEGKLRGSFEEQARILQTATGAPWLTRGEARGRMNLPEIEGADQLVVPLNVLEGGQASPTDAGEGRPPGSSRTSKARAPSTHDTKHAEVLKAHFRRQAKAVRSALGANKPDWWDTERWDRELGGDLFRLALQASKIVADDTLDRLGFDPEADYDPDRTLAFLTAMSDRIAGSVNHVTKTKIEEAMAEAEGDPLPAVDHVFEVAEESRAAEIAVATVTAVSGFAATEAAKQVTEGGPAQATKTWNVNSSNPRPSHAAMNGETVPIDAPFSNGADWPGDGRLDAGEIAGCQCSVTITIE